MRRTLPLLALLLLSACENEKRPDWFGGNAYAIDGDTLLFEHNTRVRLWGIDAPEMGTFAGDEARLELARLIDDTHISCLAQGASYDRIVARCHLHSLAGADIAAVLVASGHAKDWPAYSGGYYKRFEP